MDIQMVLILVMAAVSMVESNNATLEIKGGSVNNHKLRCNANERIQLNSYRYRSQNSLQNRPQAIRDPERLFAACSWRQNCSLSRSLVQQITEHTIQGHLYIIHRCPSAYSTRDLCNTTLRHNGVLNLVFNPLTMAGENNRRSCFCNVAGIFKLKAKDIRLTDFETGSCPSVSIDACNVDECKTITDCNQNIILNKMISSNATTGYISMTGLSKLKSPSLIWIQILHKDKNWYNISCSDITSAVSTSPTETESTTTDTEKTTVTPVSESKATDTEATTTETNTVPSEFESTLRSETVTKGTVSYKSTEPTGATDTRKQADDTHDDGPPSVTVAVPVVVGSVVITAVVVVVVYCKKSRKKQEYKSSRMSNPAYEAKNEEMNTHDEVPATRTSLNSNGVPAAGDEGHYMDVADDERYNEPTSEIDNEYNKIQFKSTPIPVDENYGHINQTNNTEHLDYDHIKGIKVTEFTPYSNGYAQGIQYTVNGTINKKATDHDIIKENSDDVSMTYDHLGQTDKRQTQVTDDQDANYSQIFPRSNRLAGKEQLNNDCMMLKNDKSSVETNDEASNMNHEYFILEPNGERPDDQRFDKEDDGEAINDHQYFVLEPQSPES